jgi:hypothetical protein
MTIVFIIIALIVFCIWTCICYLLMRYIVFSLIKAAKPKVRINETVVVILSIIFSGLSVYYFVFTSPAKNYEDAYIVKSEDAFKVTLKGKRISMSHDFVSAIVRKTHEDSVSFFLPRKNGSIKSNEILMFQNINKSTGAITINEKRMRVNLFYDDKQKEPCSWNGKYKLIER